MLKLLYFDLLRLFRTNRSNGTIATNLLFGFLYFILAIYIIGIAFFVPEIVRDSKINISLPDLLSNVIVYYFFADLFSRFIMQKVRGSNLKPLLTIPFSRGKIAVYLILKSFLSLFNLTAILFFIPLGIRIVFPLLGFSGFIYWLLFIFTLICINNLITVFISKISELKPYISIIYLLFLVILKSTLFFTTNYSGFSDTILFNGFFVNHYLYVVAFGVLIIGFVANFVLFKKFYHIEIEKEIQTKYSLFTNFSFKGIKALGVLENLELRLLLRNKRPRISFINALIVPLLGWFILTSEQYSSQSFMFLYFGTLITAILPVSYSQFAFAWESAFFDGYMSCATKTEDYIKAKFRVIKIFGLINLIFILPFIFKGEQVFITLLAIWIFQIGITNPINLFIAATNTKRFNLNEGIMSSQGKGAHQFIVVFITILFPIVFFEIAQIFSYGKLFLLISGIIGLLLEKSLINLLKGYIKKKKYAMAESFRIY